MFENSDDYDFIPSSSSKLASLFGGSILTDNTNNSLIYAAPKQPKLKKDVEVNETAKGKVQSSVLIAKAVTLWKLTDNDYKCLGKHGLAVIGSAELNLFEVISYKEKNNIILRRKVDTSWSFYNQKDCFSSFYDNDNQNWLVKFDNIEDQVIFCKEIRSRGANVVDNTNPISSPEKSPGDTKQSEFNSSTPTKLDIPAIPAQPLEKYSEELNSDSSGSQKRANILSRMARMGQQILPRDIIKNASTDISDSELDDSSIHKIPPRKHKRAVPIEKHVTKEEKLPQNYSEHQVISKQNNTSIPTQFSQQNMTEQYQQNMLSSYQPGTVNPILVNQSYDGLHQYIISQNMELKMNLAHISAKLDSVMNVTDKNDLKIDDSSLKSKIKTLELRSENLLTELARYEKKYNDLQEKCKKLEAKNIENDNEAVIDNLVKQIENLKKDLQIAEEEMLRYKQLEADSDKYKCDIDNYEKTIEKQQVKLKELEEFYEKNKDNRVYSEDMETLNQTILKLNIQIRDFEDRFRQLDTDKQRRVDEKQKIIDMFNDKIKQHMNNMYQSILGGFEEKNVYSVSQINSQVAQNLKATTFAIINEFKDIYSENEDV